MTKALATIGSSPNAINAAFGFEGKTKPTIPFLKINGSDDDGTGSKAPKGTWTYEDGERVLYAKEVTIRTFLKGYQYRLYDKDDKNKNDMSIIAPNFKAEFRSASGRIACGKMQNKKYKELGDNVTSSQKYFQEKVKCKLLVFGLVSGEFTDLDSKKKVKLENALFVWTVGGGSFLEISNTIDGIAKERRPVPKTPIKLMLKTEQEGSVTFFSPIPFVQTETVELVEKDLEHLEKIKEFVKENNDSVEEKYASAHKNKVEDKNFAVVSEIIEGKAKEVVSEEFTDDPLEL